MDAKYELSTKETLITPSLPFLNCHSQTLMWFEGFFESLSVSLLLLGQ